MAYGVRGAVEISSDIDNFMIRVFKQISNEFTMNTGSMTRNTKKKKIRGSTMILILSISDSNWAIKSKVSRGNHSENI